MTERKCVNGLDVPGPVLSFLDWINEGRACARLVFGVALDAEKMRKLPNVLVLPEQHRLPV